MGHNQTIPNGHPVGYFSFFHTLNKNRPISFKGAALTMFSRIITLRVRHLMSNRNYHMKKLLTGLFTIISITTLAQTNWPLLQIGSETYSNVTIVGSTLSSITIFYDGGATR